MKSQLSVEYLLTTLVSLLLLSVSVGVLIEIQSLSSLVQGKSLFNREANLIFLKAEEVCILGDGNSREFYVSSSFNISGEGGITISSGNYSLRRDFYCSVVPSSVGPGKIVVANERGEIIFS